MRITQSVYMVGSGAFGFSHALDCHVYLIVAGDEVALIDAGAGSEPERIMANVRADGVDEGRIAHLLLTHGHADHAGGARTIVERTRAMVYCSAHAGRMLSEGSDAELGLDRAKLSGIYPREYAYAHTPCDVVLQHGDEVRLGGMRLQVLHIKGHTPGSLCYLLEDEGRRMLFSGDSVFHGGTIGLGNWEGSSLQDYRQSIGRLSGLAVDALFPGHFLWTLEGGQDHLNAAVTALGEAWVPPAWQHMHTHR